MKKPYFIKICGITTVEDALVASEAGATAIGFNFYRKSKRYIDPLKAKEIADVVRSKTSIVGVFVNHTPDAVKQIASTVKLNLCQFHGDETPEVVNQFPNSIKTFRIGQSLGNIHFDEYRCNSFLLDTFNENEYGGTGKTFNWLLAREANEFGKIILAGGLHPENVKHAIETAQPWGVDVSSGVEYEPGRKDKEKVFNFVNNAKVTFEELLK